MVLTNALEFLQAPNLNVPHGFTTRTGGISEAPYDSLNLGLSSGDAEAPVAENRRRVLEAFGVDQTRACAVHQMHSADVVEASASWFEEEADGMVTDTPGLLLIISTADCLPVLFHDPVRGTVGAAHCGWRGTVRGIAGETVRQLRERYGSRSEDLRVAFGPSIGAPCYQVGPEVIAAFRDSGFPETIYIPDDEGRYRLDVAAANRWTLLEHGVRPENIWESGLCTHCDPERFFSHRRDVGRTGRHWAVVSLEER